MKNYLIYISLFIISSTTHAQNAIEVSAMGGYQLGGNYGIETGNIKIDSKPSFGFMVGIPVPETLDLMAEVAYSFTSNSLSYQEQSNLPIQDLFHQPPLIHK